MTPADRRIGELIEKWLASIDLHLRYVELDDEAYARAQPWPKHDRPTRWVLEVARQKLLELQAQCETRRSMGDGKFAESLELMAFLANLVGVQHIQRYIPLAEPARSQAAGQQPGSPSPAAAAQASARAPSQIQDHRQSHAQARPATGGESADTRAAPQADAGPRPPPAAKPSARARSAEDETTREMPRLRPSGAAKAHSPPSQGSQTQNARNVQALNGRPGARPAHAHRAASAAKAPATSRPAGPNGAPADMKGKIIADAVRLLKWGKPWHELAELIARIAERPSAGDIRKVLRANRAEIEAKAK